MTSAAIEIREGGPEDVELLAELGATAFTEAFPSNDLTDMEQHVANEYSHDAIAAELAAPGSRFFIATVADEAVGYAFLQRDVHEAVPGANPIELNRIYALQGWVGKGIGDALMERCLTAARAEGHDVIWLGTWDQNARAIRFYEKWGFEKVGTKTFLIGSDLQSDVVMARPV